MQKLYYCIVKNFRGKVVKRFTGNTHVFAIPINDESFYYMALVGRVKNKPNMYIAVKIAQLDIEFQRQFIIEEARFFKKRFAVVDILPCIPIFEDEDVIKINLLKPGSHIFSDIKLKYADAFTEGGSDIRFYTFEANLDLQEDNISTKSELKIKTDQKLNFLGGMQRLTMSKFINPEPTKENIVLLAKEEICKEFIKEAINESVVLNQCKPELKNKVSKNVNLLSYVECLAIVNNTDKIPVTEQEIKEYEDGFFKKLLKYGLAAIAGGSLARRAVAGSGFKVRLAGAAVGGLLLWMYRTMTDPCRSEAQNAPPGKKDMVYSLCKVRKTALILQHIRTEIAKCGVTPNPPKCRTKLLKAYNVWQKRYQKEILKHKVLIARTKELEARYKKGTSPYDM